MIKIGSTPDQYITELNYYFSKVNGCSLISPVSTLTEINANLDIVKAAYSTSTYSLRAGVSGNEFIVGSNLNSSNFVSSTWWNNSWKYRTKLSINASSVLVTTNNSAVRFHLDRTKFDFSKMKSDGADIRFVTMSGTVLKHEIEYWDNTTGSEDAVCWVLIPTITAGVQYDNFICLYYGNSAATDVQDKHGLWTAVGAVGVWHFAEGSGTDVHDSCESPADGVLSYLHTTPKWTRAAGVSAIRNNEYKIGTGELGTEMVIFGNPVKITELTGDISIVTWYKFRDAPPHLGATISLVCADQLGDGSLYSGNFAINIAWSDERVYINIGDGVLTGRTDSLLLTEWEVTDMPLNVWRSFIGYVDGYYIKCFMDGSDLLDSEKDLNQTWIVNGGARQKATAFRIGGPYPFTGDIDEVRIYNRKLSLSEAIIDKANQLDNLVNYGTEDAL